jgi:DNA replication protein DnaC
MQHRAPHRLQFPVVAAAAVSRNLPAATTRLIGREDAIAEIVALLANNPDGHRFVTLTGTGGSGKTRLALAVADAIAKNAFHNVAFYAGSLDSLR